MSTYENLLTPATYVASDDGMRSSPEASARHRRRWKGGFRKHSLSSPQLLSSKGKGKGSGDGPHKVVKNKPNVIKRAIHKIGKKTKRPSSPPGPSSSSDVANAPPKVSLSVRWCRCTAVRRCSQWSYLYEYRSRLTHALRASLVSHLCPSFPLVRPTVSLFWTIVALRLGALNKSVP